LVKAILKLVRPDRQMSVWSAIWSLPVQDFVAEIMQQESYIRLNIGSLNFLKNLRVSEIVYVSTSDSRKGKQLEEILQDIQKNSRSRIKMIVFAGTYRRLRNVMNQVSQVGIDASTINGNQKEETNINRIQSFRKYFSIICPKNTFSTEISNSLAHFFSLSHDCAVCCRSLSEI
jgi:superfamily II DNA/RNA helicase